MVSMTLVSCGCCRNQFQARTADVNRGWGKFCSKSCKAINQVQRKNKKRRRKVKKVKTSERRIISHVEYMGTIFDSDGNSQ